eukprot:scaffold220597_cov42-Prasinocladus_malaysianus.AAC.1
MLCCGWLIHLGHVASVCDEGRLRPDLLLRAVRFQAPEQVDQRGGVGVAAVPVAEEVEALVE